MHPQRARGSSLEQPAHPFITTARPSDHSAWGCIIAKTDQEEVRGGSCAPRDMGHKFMGENFSIVKAFPFGPLVIVAAHPRYTIRSSLMADFMRLSFAQGWRWGPNVQQGCLLLELLIKSCLTASFAKSSKVMLEILNVNCCAIAAPIFLCRRRMFG